MRRFPALLALLLLTVVLAANIYRAATQSFTSDEARTFNDFVRRPAGEALAVYDANNHVLNTLLARISAAVLGVSKFTLRLPSLAGGALYLAAVWVLSRRLFGNSWRSLVAVSTLALNPYILDFLSAARGYGMALALLLWALEFLSRYQETLERKHLNFAALALALALASNLTLAFPGTALAALAAAQLMARREFRTALDDFLLPGLLAAFLLLVLPLRNAAASNFYVGLASLRDSYQGLIVSSIYHSTRLLPEAAGQASLLRFWLYRTTLALAPVVALAAAAAIGILLSRRKMPAPHERFVILCGGAWLGSLALLVAAHRFFGVPYPEGRTGLYLIPLFCLTAFALLAWAQTGKWTARTLAPLGLLYFGLCAFDFARSWNTSFYLEWPFDARTEDVLRWIEERHAAQPRPLRLSVAGPTVLTLEFYRHIRPLDWLTVVNRGVKPEPADFYLLPPGEAAGYQVLWRDDLARVVLATAASAPGP
ncbi:MAG: glycosyltransferase family 39 protein [Acidobacteria bacterium]|nr:glycosyltransferase family 39 protein [Acidobacteriota bacterium]